MAQKTYAIPAMGAGHFEMMGAISSAGAMRLDVPEGILNIGGNGMGFVLPPLTDWDPTALGNHDGSLDGLALGDDVYLYATQGADGRAGLIASTNITVPGGWTAETSRRIGGFHYGRVRPSAQRYVAAYAPVVQMVPNSVWDLGHRPTCDPTGMAEVKPGLWADIYLASIVSGSWPDAILGSVYGVQPVRDTPYNRVDLMEMLQRSGKREPTYSEWILGAHGAPAGTDGSNDTAWARTTNTGPTTTGAVAKSVSCANLVDTVGNLYEQLAHHYDIGDYNGSVSTYAWDEAAVKTGVDSAFARGFVSHVRWFAAIAGGNYLYGRYCGSRSLATGSSPWHATGDVGVRGFCESI